MMFPTVKYKTDNVAEHLLCHGRKLFGMERFTVFL